MVSLKACCRSAHRTGFLAILGSFLCSSCCLIQLAFNFLSLGCAGFSVLEPYKGVFRAITAALLIHLILKQGLTRRTIFILTICISISASQELLSLHNKGALQQLQPPQLHKHLAAMTGRLSHILLPHNSKSAAQSNSNSGQALQHVRFRIQGMRCEGCAAYLKEQLSQVQGVHSCTVNFVSKEVAVELDTSITDIHKIVSAIQAVYSSYTAEVLPIQARTYLSTDILPTND